MHNNLALSHRLYLAEQVREFDRLAIEHHALSGIRLMKRAASTLVEVAQQRWPAAKHFAVVCGAGNNGGDGLLFAALAANRDFQVTVIHTREPAQLQGDAKNAWAFAQQAAERGALHFVPAGNESDLKAALERADLVVDCLLGTGLCHQVRTLEQQIVERINSSKRPVLAADVPSGLNSDSGAVMGAAVRADCTLSFVANKLGLFTASGPACRGELMFTALGIPLSVYDHQQPVARLLDLRALQPHVPTRMADAHKGRHGHTLLIGGDEGMGGAIILAARAALYAGSGLVTVASREAHIAPALAQQAELMVHAVRQSDDLRPLLARCSSVVIGPGLGQSSWSRGLLHALLRQSFNGPIVLDADALNLIAEHGWQSMLKSKQVLTTPHPGEAGRLLGCSAAQVQADRLNSVRQLQAQLGGGALLKGAGTLLCSAEAEVFLCPYGNAAMAAGGMGDVLSGLVGALLAQGLCSFKALQLGSCLHSAAADQLVAKSGTRIGLTASELLPVIRQLLNQPKTMPGPAVHALDHSAQKVD